MPCDRVVSAQVRQIDLVWIRPFCPNARHKALPFCITHISGVDQTTLEFFKPLKIEEAQCKFVSFHGATTFENHPLGLRVRPNIFPIKPFSTDCFSSCSNNIKVL